jgi:zinc/manganese transport system substrate-binding protein
MVVAALVLGGCSVGAPVAGGPTPGIVRVVAAENFWGSIAAQLGGAHAEVTSIVTNPDADPHSYEPTARDGRDLAIAQMVVANGVGYDPWVTQLLGADPGQRTVLTVGTLLGLPDGSNPHRWYDPGDVQRVAAAITADYSRIDPADRAYFDAARIRFDTVSLAAYHRIVTLIHQAYAGTPVGASESIFSLLAPALGLDVVTPPTFLRAVSEGTDVTAADKATIDAQIRHRAIKIYVYNSQNATPDVQAQLEECRRANIPTATITETLVPASASYQDWQVAQLQGILGALQRAGAR